ncbi:hypothetical protein F5B19DRAFT_505461 [Rostrohypoxylon terebratum]|nr:hypothetical protein F5B19DRAFT_505461 [Rostrohypoxylon terebratum]
MSPTNPPNSHPNTSSNSSPSSRNQNASESGSPGWAVGPLFSQTNQIDTNNASNTFRNPFEATAQSSLDPIYEDLSSDVEMIDVSNTTDPDEMDWEDDTPRSTPTENDHLDFKASFAFQPTTHNSHSTPSNKSRNANRSKEIHGYRRGNGKQWRRSSYYHKWDRRQGTIQEESDMMEVDEPLETSQTTLTNSNFQISQPYPSQNFYISPLQAPFGSTSTQASSSPSDAQQTIEDEDDPMEGL